MTKAEMLRMQKPVSYQDQQYNLFNKLRKEMRQRVKDGFYKTRPDLEQRYMDYDPAVELMVLGCNPESHPSLVALCNRELMQYVHVPKASLMALEQAKKTGAPIIIQIAPFAAGQAQVEEPRKEIDVTPEKANEA